MTGELYDVGTRVGCLLLSAILFITGTVGNILIIWTILTTKNLRTSHNSMIVVLAIVDLILCGYGLPYNMNTLFKNTVPEYHGCRFQAIMTAFLFTCSILFIMLIALSRYIKICHSKSYSRIFQSRNLIITYTFFIISASCFSSPLWFEEKLWLFEKPMHACVFNRYDNVVYSTVFMSTVIAVPAAVTSYCYISIYRFVRKARNQLHKHWNNGFARQKLTSEEMMARTQFAVFIVYLFMYFPFAITALGGSRSNFPDGFHTLALYMAYTNSCCNCLLYGILNKNMRKAYKESLFCLKRNKTATVTPATVSGIISSSTRRETYLTKT